MTPPGPSPFDRSLALSVRVLAVLLAVLSLIMVGAAILMLSLDESTDHVERGVGLAGIAVPCALLSGLFFWLAHRKSSAHPAGPEIPPATQWQRRMFSPAWTDWLSLLLPLLLVGLPIMLVRSDPFSPESLTAVAGLTVLLDLFILAALVRARYEWVRVQIDPRGLLLAQRNGTLRLLQPGELREVYLSTATLDTVDGPGLEIGTLILRLTTGKEIIFRERMSAPLPDIARACATHMNVHLSGTWGDVPRPPTAGADFRRDDPRQSMQ